jgi:hypothetical protein
MCITPAQRMQAARCRRGSRRGRQALPVAGLQVQRPELIDTDHPALGAQESYWSRPRRILTMKFGEIATLLANYGVPVDEDVTVYRLAGVAPDLDLVCAITDGLHAEWLCCIGRWRGSGRLG